MTAGLPPRLNTLLASEKERLSRELAACAETAFARAGMVQSFFRINGHVFAMRFAGRKLADHMSRALRHLAVESEEEALLTIDCWDTATTGVTAPQPDWPASCFHGRGDLQGLDTPEMRIAFFGWLRLLNVYFPESGRAYYCLAEADPFPLQQFGSPALTIFSWWFDRLGWQFTHAAVVGTGQGAVLVVGHGGAGKSTLAFSTIGSPLRYLSDDYCVLIPGDPPQAVALYNSGKLTAASLNLLPRLQSRTANGDDPAREKAVLFLHEEFPGEQLLQAPLRAIVLSDLHREETTLLPASTSEVLGILGRSTLNQLAGSGSADFMRMMRLMKGLPAYRLCHGSHISATHKLLLSLCES